MGSTRTPKTHSGPAQAFATTQWSVVLAAGGSDTLEAREALSRLCQTYWYPLYAYARRKGHSPQDAEDLTQGFFLELLSHNWIARADFHPFVRRIHQHALGQHWLIAQLVAPQWNENQAKQVVWPTERPRYPGAKFTTEQFIDAVVADLRTKVKLDPSRIFLLGATPNRLVSLPRRLPTNRTDSPFSHGRTCQP